MAMPAESGILCVTRNHSTSTLPSLILLPYSTVWSDACDVIFASSRRFNKAHRELCAVAGREMQFRKQMLRRPDVIEVSVRKEHAADKLLLSFEERDIGNEVIDAEHSLFRELEPEVDDEEIFIHLYNHAVSSDFFES